MAYQKVLADLKADSTLDEAHSFDMRVGSKKRKAYADDRGRRIINQRTKNALKGMISMSLHLY